VSTHWLLTFITDFLSAVVKISRHYAGILNDLSVAFPWLSRIFHDLCCFPWLSRSSGHPVKNQLSMRMVRNSTILHFCMLMFQGKVASYISYQSPQRQHTEDALCWPHRPTGKVVLPYNWTIPKYKLPGRQAWEIASQLWKSPNVSRDTINIKISQWNSAVWVIVLQWLYCMTVCCW